MREKIHSLLSTPQNLRLYGYVILENHLHLVAQANDISKTMHCFKAWTARCIIDHLQEQKANFLLQKLAFHKKWHKTQSDYQLWQEGNHPQMIESPNVLMQKLEYIHQNPVKRGYVSRPEHWRYSSATNYVGEKGLIEVYLEWR